MYKYEINLLADRIFELFPEYSMNERAVILAILLHSDNKLTDSDLAESNWGEFAIHHQCRASVSAYGYPVRIVNCMQDPDYQLRYELIFELIDSNSENRQRSLSIDLDLPNGLLNRLNEIVQDAMELVNSLIANIQNLNVVINDKFSACLQLINCAIPTYNNAEGSARSYIATTIGAALFYLPHGVEYWSEKISVKALERKTRGLRVTKDHIYSRKRAAEHALGADFQNVNEFMESYSEIYAEYTLLTPEENTILVNYYLNFENYEEALEQHGINLLRFNGGSPHLNRFCSENQNLNFEDLGIDDLQNRIDNIQ